MSFTEPCATIIDPPHSDGTPECEHIGEEHSYNETLGWFGACKFCSCGDYTESDDAPDEEGF